MNKLSTKNNRFIDNFTISISYILLFFSLKFLYPNINSDPFLSFLQLYPLMFLTEIESFFPPIKNIFPLNTHKNFRYEILF